MRTQEETTKQIEGLKALKSRLPEFSGFGTPNHEKIDAQLDILEGITTLEDYPEGDWDEMDNENEVYRAAEEAEEWLNGDRDEDLFE